MELSWIFTFLILLILLLPCEASDRLALLSFKSAISGDPTRALPLWNDSTDHCQWPGLKCSRRHAARVTELDLDSYNIAGSIPPSLANLTFLQRLNLPNNRLHGQIPPEIGKLRRLRYLNLSSNSLDGEIPVTLSQCSQLQVISLRSNKLTGEIPPEFGSLPKLIYLDLASNNLTGDMPSSLGNLSSLLALELFENSISRTIPPSLGHLSSLVFLRLYSNSLIGSIPLPLGNLSSLQYFDLSYNNLTGELSSSLTNLSSLTLLDITTNSISGSIPPSLGDLSSLTILALTANSFSGNIPGSLGLFPSLSVLALSHNKLSGEVPKSIYNLSTIEYFGIANNNLTGALPQDFGKHFPRLKGLLLYFNKLHGQIPESLANATRLADIELTGNNFTGNIPTSIGTLPDLYWLSLDRNQLEARDEKGWRFLTSLTNCSKLQVLSLELNGLGGIMPTSVGNLSRSLKWLTMGGNQLSGSIPASIGQCQALGTLDLSDNTFSGPIPIEVLSISSLSKYLDLSKNFLSGSLPPEAGRLKNLREFYVESNELTGEIPGSIGQCQVLEILHLNYNKFQGAIPQSLSSLRGLQDLNLASNNFSGSVPEFLEDFSLLQNLNLSFNNFEGQVPTGGVFGNLSAVALQGNQKLCGGDPTLNLSSCTSPNHFKSDKSHRLKIVLLSTIAALLVLLVVSLIALWYWMHKRGRAITPTTMKGQHGKVSYFDILKATNGFSSDNLIGVGGFGSVYKGMLDIGEEKVVAVKVLNLQKKGALKSFTAECDALKAIRHRNLLKIITSCSSVDNKGNEFKAIIFKYMKNGSLDDWLHGEERDHRRLSLLQRFNTSIDVASALEYLHHHGATPVVHCDLKPSNILLDDDFTAHLGDFGLAKLLGTSISHESSQSSAGGIKGTVGYAAPEYGMANEASIKGDIYSYGILLLEIFTGKRPTDESFKEGLSLHRFVEMALADQVMDIIDPYLLSEVKGVFDAKSFNESMTSALQIGLSCSKELPMERMDIRLAIRELHAIRNKLVNQNTQERSEIEALIQEGPAYADH